MNKWKKMNKWKFQTICQGHSIFFNWDPLHAKVDQPLRGMELQEKEAQKD